MRKLLISDFTINDSIAGGSELVDHSISKLLNIPIVRSLDYSPNKDDTLILSNISTMPQAKIDYIKDNCNYIIVEHDYKIHWTRHPWRFKDCIIPVNERINYDLYKNAKAIFTQTDDHLEVFKLNEVNGNFISLDGSIWSEEEIDRLSKLQNNKNTHKFAIIDSDNWIKNKDGAVSFCKEFKLDYNLIPKQNYNNFIFNLSQHSTLVFFPIARETCCRLIIEAKCMNMNVITNNNSGAFKSSWFNNFGNELINYLTINSQKNIQKIKEMIK